MSNSEFCIQQRRKEQQQLKKLLILGFASSAAIHGVLAYALPYLSFEPSPQIREPMELTLIDKPKPKPKVESKPIAKPEPKPAPKPEPVQAKTPPLPPKLPEPVKEQTPPPKLPEPVPEPPAPAPEPVPTPKEVLTTPTPAPSQPIVSAPVANTAQSNSMSSSLSAANSSAAVSNSSSISGKPGETGSVVAANSVPPRPENNSESEEGIRCISNCEPEYPSTLDGVEGSAGVKLTIDSDGNVIGVELADPDGNTSVNRQALLAARQMQFSSPGDSSASIRVKIDFTVEGSEYDRLAREDRERKEQAAREKEEQEAARQQQLEAEQQAQKEQLERERQAAPAPEPLPVSPEELDEERLRKFRERMENYQQQ